MAIGDLFDPSAGAMPGAEDEFGLTPQPPATPDKFVGRETPDVPEPRRKLVEEWQTRVKEAKEHWEPVFRRMRENMAFADGRQWPDFVRDTLVRDDRYVANICLRHVQQRTAELYPHNPTMRAQRSEKIIAMTWDGSAMALIEAEQSAQQALSMMQMPDPNAMMVLQDAQQVKQFDQLMDRIGKTLTLVYDYNIREQTHSFKGGMKTMVRRAIITCVGYVKLGFQRAMKMRPEIEARIADMSERLANIERLMADMADGEFLPDSAEAEQLKLAIQALTAEPQLIVREGLSFNYPDSTAIIPDPRCRSLKNFVGADWAAEEYILTPDEVQEVYMVDVGHSFIAYDDLGPLDGRQSMPQRSRYDAGGGGHHSRHGYEDRACVWEIYSRKDGLVFVVCDGYPDFLLEPGPPETETERFWPWFAFVMNEGYDEKRLYPQSDIDLMRDMQLELNRSRQGLREHRRANRPKTAVAAGVLEEADLEKLRTHPANALLELNALAPGQKIEDVLQAVKMPPIDPAVYDTSQTFEDVLRVLGSDQASQGTTAGDPTATEVSVAQFSQNTDTSSVVDDLNDMLSDIARTASQILMLNVSAETVTQIVGPGAVWPKLDPQTIAESIWLEIDGSVNESAHQQQDVQMLTQLVPLLQRIPGISPEWLAKQLIQRMGADIDLTDAFAEGLPSMEALNQLMAQPPQPPPGQPGAKGAGKGQPRPGNPQEDPNAQGAQGSPGGGSPPPGAPQPSSIGPRPPALQYFGNNGNRPGPGSGTAPNEGQQSGHADALVCPVCCVAALQDTGTTRIKHDMSETGIASDVSTSAPSSSAPASPPASLPASSPASSPSSSSGETTTPSPSVTDSPSPSSSETNTVKSDREGLLAAVRSVIKTSPEKPAIEADDEFGLAQDPKAQTKDGVTREPGVPPVDGASPEQAAAQTPQADDLPDPTDAELAKLRPETRKRFERLLAQRNQARREFQAIMPEIAQHRQLQGYLAQNQLAPDDVNALLGIGASLRRGDYQAFLQGVTPYVVTAQEALGLRLPQDIQNQVDQGLISIEAAGEMSRTRYRAGQAEHRLQETTAQIQRQTQETAIGQVKTAVDSWEANIRTRDPDYSHKAVAVRRFAQALLQERGSPRNVQEALALIQNAYDEATRELTRVRPAPKPTRQVPASSQGSTVTSSREPQTMKEAALRALNGTRRAV